jgi:hypothetical protein
MQRICGTVWSKPTTPGVRRDRRRPPRCGRWPTRTTRCRYVRPRVTWWPPIGARVRSRRPALGGWPRRPGLGRGRRTLCGERSSREDDSCPMVRLPGRGRRRVTRVVSDWPAVAAHASSPSPPEAARTRLQAWCRPRRGCYISAAWGFGGPAATDVRKQKTTVKDARCGLRRRFEHVLISGLVADDRPTDRSAYRKRHGIGKGSQPWRSSTLRDRRHAYTRRRR